MKTDPHASPGTSKLSTPGPAKVRMKKAGLKVGRSNLNLSRSRIIKALGLNTSANNSLIMRTTLKANNKALAQALEQVKRENRSLNQVLLEEKAQRQGLLVKLATLERVAGLTNDNIDTEVQKRYDDRMSENRVLLNTIVSQLMGIVHLLGKAFSNTSSRSSSIEPQQDDSDSPSQDTAAPVRRSIYNPTHNLFNKGLARKPGCGGVAESVSGQVPVQMASSAANLSLIAECEDMTEDGDVRTCDTVTEDEGENDVVCAPKPDESNRSHSRSLVPRRVLRKGFSANVSPKHNRPGGSGLSSAEASEPEKSSTLGENPEAADQSDNGKIAREPSIESNLPSEKKSQSPNAGKTKPSKRSKRKKGDTEAEKSSSPTAPGAEGQAETESADDSTEVRGKGQHSNKGGVARRGTFVLPPKPVQPSTGVVAPDRDKKTESKSGASSQTVRRETFLLPTVLHAVEKPNKTSKSCDQETNQEEKSRDDRPAKEPCEEGDALGSRRQTFCVPNPFKRSTKCVSPRAPIQTGSKIPLKCTEESSRNAGVTNHEVATCNKVDTARKSPRGGRPRRGTFEIVPRTDSTSSDDAPPLAGAQKSKSPEKVVETMSSADPEELITDENEDLLVERSMEEGSPVPEGVGEGVASEPEVVEYGAGMMMDDDATVVMDMDMDFTEVINIPIILAAQSVNPLISNAIVAAQQQKEASEHLVKSGKDGTSEHLVKSGKAGTSEHLVKEPPHSATEAKDGKKDPKPPSIDKESHTDDSSDGQEKSLSKPSDTGRTSQVEVRVGKLGDVRYAVGRKDADGVRKAVPQKLPSKTRSKQRKLKAPGKISGKVLEPPGEAGAGPPSIFDYHDKTPRVTKEKTAPPEKSVFDVSLNESCVNQKFTFSEFRKHLSKGSSASTDDDQRPPLGEVQPVKNGKPQKPRSKARSKVRKTEKADQPKERAAVDTDQESDTGSDAPRSKARKTGKVNKRKERTVVDTDQESETESYAPRSKAQKAEKVVEPEERTVIDTDQESESERFAPRSKARKTGKADQPKERAAVDTDQESESERFAPRSKARKTGKADQPKERAAVDTDQESDTGSDAPRSKARKTGKVNKRKERTVVDTDQESETESEPVKRKAGPRRRSMRLESVKDSSDSEKEKGNGASGSGDKVAQKTGGSQKNERKLADAKRSKANDVVNKATLQSILVNTLVLSDEDSPVIVKRPRQKKRVTIAITQDTDSEGDAEMPQPEPEHTTPTVEETPVLTTKRHRSRLSERPEVSANPTCDPPELMVTGEEIENKENQEPDPVLAAPSVPLDVLTCPAPAERSKRTSREALSLFEEMDPFAEGSDSSRKRTRRGAAVCYKQPSLNSKLRQGDKHTTNIYGSEHEMNWLKAREKSRSKGRSSIKKT